MRELKEEQAKEPLEQRLVELDPQAEDDARDTDDASDALEQIVRIFAEQDERDDPVQADPDEPDAKPISERTRKAIKEVLKGLHGADIAYVLEALPQDDRLAVWNLTKGDQDGDVLVEVNEGVREALIEAMDREELVDAVETLDTDEIADLVEDLPADVVAEVQEGLSHEERAQLRAAMSYPEDSVGARMDFEMLSIREEVSVGIVMRFLRRFESLPDHTDQVFVVDRQGRLLGALPLSRIVTHAPEEKVSDLMRTDLLKLNPLDKAVEAAQAFERYDLVSAPVIDEAEQGFRSISDIQSVVDHGHEVRLRNAGGILS